MARPVEFWFDVGSPAAYLAWTQLPRLARDTGARIDLRPFLLGGVFHATGNRSPSEVASKGQYMMDDLGRFARRYGVAFAPNPHFPINTLALMRMAVGLQLRDAQRMRDFVETVFRAIWVEGRHMGDPAVVAATLQGADFEAQELLALAADPQVKEQLRKVTQEAVERGVFGAPTFFVGEQMYWGQDRLDFVQEAIQQ